MTVARRFLWTSYGPEALQLLAVQQLQKELPGLAAATFQRLLQRQPADKLDDETLFLAARSFRQTGDRVDVAFDGAPDDVAPDGARVDGVGVYYAAPGSDADSRIRQLVEAAPDRGAEEA